jgi:ABC-type proline/glycine betaine transport system permease subunit
MSAAQIHFSPGAFLAPAVDWLNTHLHGLFKVISQVIEAVLGGVEGNSSSWARPLLRRRGRSCSRSN